MDSSESNEFAKQELDRTEKKVNLYTGYKHSSIFGSPRRCTNKYCMEAFTPHKVCPGCNCPTKSLKN